MRFDYLLLYCGNAATLSAAHRYFLDNCAGWILELDRGAGIPFEGNYSGMCWGLVHPTQFCS